MANLNFFIPMRWINLMPRLIFNQVNIAFTNMKLNKISYLLLSLTRVSGTGNGSGTYNLGQTLPGVTKIKLQHMSFYNTFYNVSATNNICRQILYWLEQHILV